MDVLTGLVVTIVGIWQINNHRHHTLIKWCAALYIAFGVLVALAAVMPLNCDPENHSCGPLLHNPILIVHGLSSILSVVFLFLSMVLAIGVSTYRKNSAHLRRWLFGLAVLAWAAFVIGYFVEVVVHVSNNVLQYYFITVCSISIVLVVGAIEYLHLTIDSQHPASERDE